MQSESDFIALDSVMIVIAVLCLTAFHPGFIFPEMQMHGKTSPVGEFTAATREKVLDAESTRVSFDKNQEQSKTGYFGSAR